MSAQPLSRRRFLAVGAAGTLIGISPLRRLLPKGTGTAQATDGTGTAQATGGAGPGVGSVTAPVVSTMAPPPCPAGFLDARQIATLQAAVAQIIPAEGPGDWSAADLGAACYIQYLLSGFDDSPLTGYVYTGGPYRLPGDVHGTSFATFQVLTRVKAIGWARQVAAWRSSYSAGLADLDRRAGGDFAACPVALQIAILQALDYEGSTFFADLYDNTMEAVYANPVYGGNRGYESWRTFGYTGDVHGIRFPTTGTSGPWDVYGGYSPEEMALPGPAGGGESPVISPPYGPIGQTEEM